MKAIIYEQYGPADVLKLAEVAKPVPKNNEVLIRVCATSVTAGDWRLRKADPFLARLFNGLFRPRRVNILGFELAGVVEETGAGVTAFKKGDAVFAFCGLKFGGYAEYKCMAENEVIALKPANITFEAAAVTPLGATTALVFLRKGGIRQGQNVLIYGASGSVGTFAVQIAKHFGARVTAVCSTGNLEMVGSIGADEVIDYTREDFTALETKFDLIFDAVGKTKSSVCRHLLAPGGKFVTVNGQAKPAPSDLQYIREMLEAGKLHPVIDRVYSLEQIPEAHRYVEQFHKKGNVAVKVG